MVEIEVGNRSGVEVDEPAAVEVARRVLAGEGVEEGELGITFVGPEEIRFFNHNHRGKDEETDVLSFPIDSRDDLPPGVPRVLGEVLLCPQVTGPSWNFSLVHGVLHVLGYDHGDEMESREEAYER